MKKILMTTALVISMLTMFVGTAAAAPLSSGTAVLAKVEYVPGKGPVFTFTVTGKFSKSELKGTMHVEGGADYSLNCAQVDSSTVKCTASKKAAGKNVVISWGGNTFWTYVPNDPNLNCYLIYDWTPNIDGWAVYGHHCQPNVAQYGDTFDWNNPYWGLWTYEFLPASPVCSFGSHSGDSYYYPWCY